MKTFDRKYFKKFLLIVMKINKTQLNKLMIV